SFCQLDWPGPRQEWRDKAIAPYGTAAFPARCAPALLMRWCILPPTDTERPMLSTEQNDLITPIGPGRPAGTVMRRYWQPAALVDELAGNRPVKALRLLGEDLVLFRDDKGRCGLLSRSCPHRGTDLAFGRLEDGGLRCAFHGWLFDVSGQCLETPAEPEGSKMCANTRQPAYPVVEKSGILFAYLGPGEPPAFPHFDCFVAPASHTFAFKGMIDCNWLQSLEVGIDPAHTS